MNCVLVHQKFKRDSWVRVTKISVQNPVSPLSLFLLSVGLDPDFLKTVKNLNQTLKINSFITMNYYSSLRLDNLFTN